MTTRHNEKGNTTYIALIVLAVIAVGALAYFASDLAGKQSGSTETAATESTDSAISADNEIAPGNPVVATVNGEDILRSEIVNYINTLPTQVKQLPLDQLFPAAVNEIVNERLTVQKSANSNLETDAEIQERLAEIKKGLVATAFLQNTINETVTEDRLKESYDLYVENFPEIEEAKAAHILVADEAKAKELIEELEKGADFAEIAKEHSTDTATAVNGGELTYLTKGDLVPEFADAAFSQEIGKHSFQPVKTQFGYHIVKTLDKRMRKPATFEEAKPLLENQLRQAALQKTLTEWRAGSDIVLFDINGNPVAVSAGEE